MSQQEFSDLESLVDKPDEEFKEGLPDVLGGIEDSLDTLLLEHPDAFEDLVTRMGTMENPSEFVEGNLETARAFFDIMWGCLNIISENVPDVQDAVTNDMSVNWVCDDTDLAWHMESDSESGTITGGSGKLDNAELTFTGTTDILLSMIGDDDFQGQQAFMQGKFQIEGQLPKAMALENMMESVMTNAQEFEMD